MFKVRYAFFTVAILALASPVFAGDEPPVFGRNACEGIPDNDCVAFRTALNLQSSSPKDSLLKLDILSKKYPLSFSIQYAYGRLLAQNKNYSSAIDQLEKTIKLGPESPGFDPGIYNTIGFALLVNGQYEKALDNFSALETSPTFEKQSKVLKMKLHNNSGVAYMQLDRYKEAEQQFNKAKDLGSTLAIQNLEKIASILATLEDGDLDIPGVFAVIVASARTKETALTELSKKAALMGLPSSEFSIYLAPNKRYLIALASYLSYPKAKQLSMESKDKGIKDSYIGSITEWVEVKIPSQAGA